MRRILEAALHALTIPADIYWGRHYQKTTPGAELDAHPFVGVIPSGVDYRNFGPTTECVCGGDWFYFLGRPGPDRNIGVFFTDGMCMNCRALVKLATEVDDDPFPMPMRESDYFEPNGSEL